MTAELVNTIGLEAKERRLKDEESFEKRALLIKERALAAEKKLNHHQQNINHEVLENSK